VCIENGKHNGAKEYENHAGYRKVLYQPKWLDFFYDAVIGFQHLAFSMVAVGSLLTLSFFE
jgi:hypothetical protein